MRKSKFFNAYGFKNVNQLQGGIIQYAEEIKEKGLESNL